MTVRPIASLITAAALAAGLAVAAAPAPSAAAGASDVYVELPANGGSDAHTCAQLDPCATVARAVSAAGAGGTVHVGVGTFDGQVDINQSVAIDGVSPEQTVLTRPTLSGFAYVVGVTAGTTELSDLTIQTAVMIGVFVDGTGTVAGDHVVLANSGCALMVESGTATLTDSRVEDATPGCSGPQQPVSGQIVVDGGSVGLIRTQVLNPQPNQPAVRVRAGSFAADQSYFDDSAYAWDSNNSNAVQVEGGAATVTRSTFYAFGTGVFTAGGTSMLADDTFQHDVMGVSGWSGSTTVVRSTFLGGLGALQYSVSVAGSVIGAQQLQSCIGTITDLGYNLAAAHSCGLTAPTSRQDVTDLDLGPGLGDYGGPVPTVLIGSSSAALDSIPVGATYGNAAAPLCPAAGATDARGLPRPQAAGCDAGSMELLATATVLHAPTTAAPDDEVTLDATVDLVDHGVGPAELPAGTVTFRSDAMVLCQTTLVSGAARCTTSAGAAGGRSLTATFTPTPGSTLHPSVSPASTILVGTAPSFTTRRKRTFIVGRARAFPVRASGSPAPEITVLRGHLPAGLHLVIGAGRAVLRGTATRAAIGTHRITLGAANVAGVDKQVLRIIVRG